ncbi:MAG: APC family permease, partial [Candidatus Bathyarchaeota archaeon]|nr:APC family permease [Candidatus Bathyarchaeota archaeon]
CFAQCAALVSRVGGPYAYTKEAWGPFAGFIVGWSLWLAEWIALAVFPVAFTRYLMFFLPNLEWIHQATVKGLFVTFLVVTNIFGIRAAGKANDILTIAKLAPLVFFSGAGLLYLISNLSVASSNLSPFSPFGISNFGRALVLIFWAYAGFEISTIPADEIKDPSSTIPRAIVLGISIVTIFYLVTNFVLFGVRPWSLLASDSAPLASATTTVLNFNSTLALVGGLIVGAGALISVAGSDESGMIGTSRLGYALAADGLFPRAFARVHPRFKTPYLAILIQAVTALGASIVGDLGTLIATSVLFMAIAYAATSLSIFKLRKKFPKPKFSLKGGALIPASGAIFSLYLISQCTSDQILVGSVLLATGVAIYVGFSPRKELTEVKRKLVSRDAILERTYRQEQRFLAHVLRHLKRAYRGIAGKKQTWAE